jgi:hypothetical protein
VDDGQAAEACRQNRYCFELFNIANR